MARTGLSRAGLRCDATLVPTVLAGAVAVAYLLAPRMGWDLAAQMARADFAADHPFTPVDLRWFGGTLPFGYSLWVPAVMAVIDPRVLGALAAVAGSWLTTRLLQRAGTARPVFGGVLAAICQGGNLVEGRVTFGVGLAFGLAAVNALTGDAKYRRTLMIIMAVLAGAASPVVALLLWICAAVALLRRRFTDGVVLALASGIPTLLTSVLFADSGRQLFGAADAVRAALASMLVVTLVPRSHQAIRLGALLGLIMVGVAYLLPTPVGGNATRLTLLLALPVIAACLPWKWWIATLAVAVAAVVQTPITFGTIAGAGAAGTSASYYAPMLAEIKVLGPLTGRVEVPELNGHWEAVYVARKVPLARGWLRQLDTQLNNDVFYKNPPTAATYRQFLTHNAVQYVAVPDARLSFYGKRELTFIDSRPAYLDPVWHDSHWTLYRVRDAVPIVESPGTLLSETADSITFTAPANSEVKVNLRWFEWLTTSGTGCVARNGGLVSYHTGNSTGPHTISSALDPSGHC